MTRVIKLGGRVQHDAALQSALAHAHAHAHAHVHANARGAGLVIVHGGGDEITQLQRRLGYEPRFVGGRRVTTDEELDAVRMVLSGTANKRLVAALQSAGVRAVGVSGEDGGLLRARVAPGAPLGRVAAHVEADPSLLTDLLRGGWTPVISPVARDADDANGAGLNVNGDDAAAAIAIAVGAAELAFISDVPGVLIDGVPALELACDEATALVERGVAAGGMAAKLQAGCRALAGGVARVRVAGIAALEDAESGTTLLLTRTVAPWQR